MNIDEVLKNALSLPALCFKMTSILYFFLKCILQKGYRNSIMMTSSSFTNYILFSIFNFFYF